jgi:hypothetical protein
MSELSVAALEGAADADAGPAVPWRCALQSPRPAAAAGLGRAPILAAVCRVRVRDSRASFAAFRCNRIAKFHASVTRRAASHQTPLHRLGAPLQVDSFSGVRATFRVGAPLGAGFASPAMHPRTSSTWRLELRAAFGWMPPGETAIMLESVVSFVWRQSSLLSAPHRPHQALIALASPWLCSITVRAELRPCGTDACQYRSCLCLQSCSPTSPRLLAIALKSLTFNLQTFHN